MTPPRLSVVVDGQFGSCGKGAVAAWLAHPEQNNAGRRRVVAVRVGGPNAGHTVYAPRCTPPDDDKQCGTCDRWGHPWRLRQIPTAAVCNPNADLVIAAGSEIDLDVLRAEIEGLEAHGIQVGNRLYIDLNATIIQPEHKDREERDRMVDRIGSTAKGIGAARADRIMREADTVRTADTAHREFYNGEPHRLLGRLMTVDTAELLYNRLEAGAHVVIEGTQGYGLGLHTEYYPQTTSGDCRAIDFLAQAGISPWGVEGMIDLQVWVVVRPYPIRVAGNSGPLAGETTWEALGLPEEKTTVTQKVRRVGQWDPQLVQAAIRANGGPSPAVMIALTMADHIDRDVEGLTDPLSARLVESFIDRVENETKTPVALVGTSPITLVEP